MIPKGEIADEFADALAFRTHLAHFKRGTNGFAMKQVARKRGTEIQGKQQDDVTFSGEHV